MASSSVSSPTELLSNPSKSLLDSMRRHLFSSLAKTPSLATQHDYYLSLALAVRDLLLQTWVDTAETYTQQSVRTAV